MKTTAGMAAQVAAGAAKRRLGLADRPRAVVFKVTRRCNLFCEMCYTHEGQPQTEVAPAEAARFFTREAFGGLHLLRLTGGEPFLRQDFTELTQAVLAGAAPQVLYLTTNGTFVDRLQHWLEKVATPFDGQVSVQISLDAADQRHDLIRQKEGTLARTLAAIELTAGYARRLPHLGLGINQTITPHNLTAVPGVAAVAQKHGAQHTVILAQEEHETRERPSGEGGRFTLRTPLGRQQVQSLYEDIARHAPGNLGRGREKGLGARLRNATQSFVHHHESRQLLHGAPPPRLRCMAAFTYLRVSPQGDITPCTLKNHHVLGNLKHQSFEEIWFGPQAREARREVAACPGCWVECDLIPSLPYQPAFLPFVAGLA